MSALDLTNLIVLKTQSKIDVTNNKGNKMKKKLVSVLVLSFAILTISACSTFEGMGKDLQRMGRAVEGEAQKH